MDKRFLANGALNRPLTHSPALTPALTPSPLALTPSSLALTPRPHPSPSPLALTPVHSENFSYTNIPGKDPVLVFVDAAGTVLETVDVAAMKTEEIIAQLTSRGFRLKQAAAPAEAQRDEL